MALGSSADIALRFALALTLPALLSVAMTACGPDWDVLDPSLGGPVSGISASSSSSGGSGGSGGGPSGSGGSGGAMMASSSSTGVGGATGGGGAGGGPVMAKVEYVASIADCLDPFFNDPNDCEDATGFGTMNVDLEDSLTGAPNYSFIRFDLDGAILGKTILAVTLELTVGMNQKSSSPQTGEVWQVTSFTRPELFNTLPKKVGGSALAGNHGPVTQGQDVEWNLPLGIVKANNPVFVGVYPLSTDGVDYSNLKGGDPPKLIIEYQ